MDNIFRGLKTPTPLPPTIESTRRPLFIRRRVHIPGRSYHIISDQIRSSIARSRYFVADVSVVCERPAQYSSIYVPFVRYGICLTLALCLRSILYLPLQDGDDLYYLNICCKEDRDLCGVLKFGASSPCSTLCTIARRGRTYTIIGPILA